MTATLMQPLQDEHARLVPEIAALRVAADTVGSGPLPALRDLVDQAFGFLVHHLIPHASAEDRALYPVVQRLMGSPRATATMSRDHVEVGRLTEELGRLRSTLAGAESLPEDLACALRRVLYGLFTLVTVHFAKEEEVYVPLLEAGLSASEAAELFGAMHEAAEAAASAAPQR